MVAVAVGFRLFANGWLVFVGVFDGAGVGVAEGVGVGVTVGTGVLVKVGVNGA